MSVPTDISENDDVGSCKISKLVRVVARMESLENVRKAVATVKMQLVLEENRKYVQKAFGHLVTSLQDTFSVIPTLSWKEEAITELADLLHALDAAQDDRKSSRICSWLVDIVLNKVKPNRLGHSNAVHDVFLKLISNTSQHQLTLLPELLYKAAEKAETLHTFRLIAILFVYEMKHLPDNHDKKNIEFFRDFVDIVIGWMVDEQFTEDCTDFCGELLILLRGLFVSDQDFAKTLINQILEDMSVASEKIHKISSVKKVYLLSKAYCSMIAVECFSDKAFIIESTEKMLSIILKVLNCPVTASSPENRPYILEILACSCEAVSYSPGANGQFTRTFVKTLIESLRYDYSWEKWDFLIISKVVEAICVWMEGVVNNTQLDDNAFETARTIMNLVDSLNEGTHKILLIHSLFRTRNVAMLQEVYSWHCSKIPNEPVEFIVAGLSDIAVNKSCSILSLWALQPSITEQLLALSSNECSKLVKMSVLELLRSHCSIHSHFVTALSGGTYATESPGSRFLPILLKHWISVLEKKNNSYYFNWYLNWIQEFFISASSFIETTLLENHLWFLKSLFANVFHITASIPFDKKQEHYVLENEIFNLFDTIFNGVDCSDPKSDPFLVVLHDCISEYLDAFPLDESLDALFQHIFNRISTLIVSRKSYFCPKRSLMGPFCDVQSLVQVDFNNFLYHLLSSTDQKYEDWNLIKSCVHHLILSKLRTPLEKPKELFLQLQSMLKRSKDSNLSSWKLDFMFLFEQAMNNVIQGSLVSPIAVNEGTKVFYETNKTPCFEWLKRIRAELADACFELNDYAGAYFHATLIPDNDRVAKAALQLCDEPCLEGLGMDPVALYLTGRYEEAFEKISVLSSEENSLINEIRESTMKILTEFGDKDLDAAYLSLPMKNAAVGNKTFLDLQLLHTRLSSDWKRCLFIDDCRQLDLSTAVKIYNLLPNGSIPGVIQRTICNAMLKLANYKWVNRWLNNEGVNIQELFSGGDELEKYLPTLFSCFTTYDQFETFLIAAEYSINTGNAAQGITLLKQIVKFMFSRDLKAQTDFQGADKILCDIANMLRIHQLIEIDDLKSWLSEVISCEDLNYHLSDSYTLALRIICEKSLTLNPLNSQSWLLLGHLQYHTSQMNDSKDFDKLNITNPYIKFLQHNSDHSSKTLLEETTVMLRLIKLLEDPSDISAALHSKRWLELLPQISQKSAFWKPMLKKFKKECSLYFFSHDINVNEEMHPINRKCFFESSAFVVTDVCDEPISSSYISKEGCMYCEKDPEILQTHVLYRDDLDIGAEMRVIGKEILRIGTSFEELWSWNVNRLFVDWNRRMSSLKKDFARDPNVLKVSSFILPIQTCLRYLWNFMKSSANSASELNFILKHSEAIDLKLRGFEELTTVEQCVQAYEKLISYADSMEASCCYKSPRLLQLSPRLADFKDWCGDCRVLGMPEGVYVSSIHPVIQALPTKTKPKKIKFRGSNGKFYEYLIKGNENLNIDSSMMQFLNISKYYLNETSWTYSVTPLGKRGGLIQMVEGIVSPIALYKKYLQRNFETEKTSELFWKKMTEAGCSDRSNPQTLKTVFCSLQSETTNELLSKEMLLCSANPRDWYNSVKEYTKDTAVSSAIGYVLGIGDRHLDNILIELESGRVVHVDFSLIFDKGATLRVPECVPFRLTQNIVNALQYPGLNGPFSTYMKRTFSQLKTFQELAFTCAHTMAISFQLEEDSLVPLSVILSSEIICSCRLLQLRIANISLPLSQTKLELEEVVKNVNLSNSQEQECQNKVSLCEKNIETLTVALSEITEAQSNMSSLTELRQRCRQCRITSEWASMPTLTTEMLLAYLTENFGRKNLATENDLQWAASMEKLVSKQLQVIKVSHVCLSILMEVMYVSGTFTFTRASISFLLTDLCPDPHFFHQILNVESNHERIVKEKVWIRRSAYNPCQYSSLKEIWFTADLYVSIDHLKQRTHAVQTKFTLADELMVATKQSKEYSTALVKKICKFQRLLCNVHSLISFLVKSVGDTPIFEAFRAVTLEQWCKNVAHFWLHSTLELLYDNRSTLTSQCEVAQLVLEEITVSLAGIYEMNSEVSESLLVCDDALDTVCDGKIRSILEKVSDKISGIGRTHTVDSLICDATSEENLCRMFEGWTPWV